MIATCEDGRASNELRPSPSPAVGPATLRAPAAHRVRHTRADRVSFTEVCFAGQRIARAGYAEYAMLLRHQHPFFSRVT